MDAIGLAQEIRRLRLEKGLSQQQVADQLVEAGKHDSLAKQMISRAEDPRITTGDTLHTLRVAILELLTGRQLVGPVWYYSDEVA